MASIRSDIISRSNNINVRDVDKGIKNLWRWEWLEKQVNGIYLHESLGKLNIPGTAYCTLCCKKLAYGSRGCVALVDHVKSDKHVNVLKQRKSHFALPGIGESSRQSSISPYGLHPMYEIHSPKAEVTLPQPSTPIADRIVNSEAMILSFLAENSLSFSLVPDLLELTKELSKDKKALDRVIMHRTVAAYKLRFGVARTIKDTMMSDLKNTFFSLNVDESTSNNHQKIVTILVNYFEKEKIVTKHLESFPVLTVNSDSIFEGILSLFMKNNIPWKNLMSILLDSCNVMRGKKSGVETKMHIHCPHLLDIDGDSCHHAHNSAKEFCKPFSKNLETLISDIHNDLKWSPDLRAILNLMCEFLNIKYTMPQNFISFRWLSIYDATQDLSRLQNALILFYFSFMCSEKQSHYLHLIVKIYKQHNVSEEEREKIRNLQTSLHKKSLTEAGKERKDRIVSKLFDNHLETKLHIGLFLSVLPLLQQYIKLFQTDMPLIHILYNKQIELIKNFLACFIKPEVLMPVSNSGKKIKNLDVKDIKNHLSKNNIFIGEVAKKLIQLAPKSSLDVVENFRKKTLAAYIACAKTLQSKMPVTNRFLKAVSSIDPWCRQHALTLELMNELPDHVTNVLTSSEEREQYQIDSLPQPEDENAEAWWLSINKSKKYPLLSKMALALLTCFHGPKVESSFSLMNSVITPETSRMNISTFDAIQTIKYELSSKKQTSVAYYGKKDFLKDPVDKNLCTNMRTAYKTYNKERLRNAAAKKERIKRNSNNKNKILSKVAAKKICAKAAEEQRKKHIKKLKSKYNFGNQNVQEEKETIKNTKTEPVVVATTSKNKKEYPPSKKQKTSDKSSTLTIKEMFAKYTIKNNCK